jgi:hypothetical protein
VGELSSLASELRSPIIRAILEFESHSRPVAISLMKPDDTGIRIWSRMSDIAPREEIGSLAFQRTSQAFISSRREPLDESFNSELIVRKFIYSRADLVVDCGVTFEAPSGQ